MRKVKNSIIKKEKGAIAIFVLVALLFMSAFLILLFANNINKSKDTQEQFKITGEIYAGEGEQGAYDQAFGELRKKNKTTLTATSQENSNTLELQNVFAEEKLSNYRIYGNSVQNGTPTPSKPVEIQSVGDKTKNLLDIDSAVNENLVKNSDGTYTIWKKGENSWDRLGKRLSISIPANTPITVSCEIVDYNGDYFYPFQIACYTMSGKEQTMGLQKGKTSTTSSFSEEITSIIIYQSSANDIGTYTTFKNLQIELGDTATSYEPYGYKIPVQVSGKNLFDIDSTLNDNLVKNDDGTYTIKKNDTNHRFGNKMNITIPANTKFTVSVETVDYNGSYSLPFQIVCYPKGGGEQYIQFGLNTKHKTYSFPEEIIGMTIYQESKMPDGTYTTFKNLQIELGETATAYEPYHAPVTTNIYLNEPLRKVGEYADYIDFKTGKVVRPVKEKIFTGEEGKRRAGKGWTAWESETSKSIGVWYCDIFGELGEDKKAHFVYAQGLCSHFIHDNLAKLNTRTDDYIGNCRFDSGANPPYFGFRVAYTTLDEWLEFLKSEYNTSHPLTVDYVLVTPTEETISLPELPAFEDYSKIEILTTVSPSKIEAEYEGYTIE